MKCDVCSTTKDLAGVACSALGPVSFQYCRSCAENYAEPEGWIAALIRDAGGTNNIRNDILDTVTFFKDGQYYPMREYGIVLPRGV